ncbi:hypothetical protein M0R45_030755 [Rubus argutus]|uniref:MHC class I antigen n=1 Tax=Rubus argutus TaxID=59490 RepID=A0AAW1WCG3_RUBAR
MGCCDVVVEEVKAVARCGVDREGSTGLWLGDGGGGDGLRSTRGAGLRGADLDGAVAELGEQGLGTAVRSTRDAGESRGGELGDTEEVATLERLGCQDRARARCWVQRCERRGSSEAKGGAAWIC